MGTEWVFSCWILTMLVCVPVFIFGIKRRQWVCIIITGLPITLFILIVTSFIYRSSMASLPSWVYKQAFRKPPKDDVQVLQSDYKFGTDFISIYLKFETSDPNHIQSLNDTFVEVSQSDFESNISGDHPDWFKPLENSPSLFLKASPYGKMYSHSKALLSYNKDNGLVYFHSFACD